MALGESGRVVFRTVVALLLAATLSTAAARAARPIVDLHRLDAYFALFAADSNVPWKTTAVRLDTYTSAPVHFSVYHVDPADVLTAGSNARPRAIATQRLHPVVSFDFSPPGGYQFQSNEVDLRLGSRQGFFVVEASRGDVGEQVWVNRSRVGLLSKQTPGELLLYGVDLGTGRALKGMRVQLVAGGRFSTALTDDRGIVRWTRSPRPVFALAQWGDSYAFLPLLPPAPLPSTIVGVRTESAVARAGSALPVVGFVRRRSGNALHPAAGTVLLSLHAGPDTIVQRRVSLDAAGAFSAVLDIPAGARAGDDALLAQADGGVGGASVHVDASSGGLSLSIAAACLQTCDPNNDVPLTLHSSRPRADVRVTVVRSPHVESASAGDAPAWGTAVWLDQTVTTDGDGMATVYVPHPTDGLASTYGVHAQSGPADADTRVIVPTARAAIALSLDRDEQTLGTPLGFDVSATDLQTGKPLSGATVTARLLHGTSVNEQRLTLGTDGRARGVFSAPQLGTNLIFASVDDGGRATDAAAVQVEARAASSAEADRSSADVSLELDKPSYHSGDRIGVSASTPNAAGDALVTLESGTGTAWTVVPVSGGRASAQLRAADSAGELRVGVAFVADGALRWATAPLPLDAAGRPLRTSVVLGGDAAFSPGTNVHVGLAGDRRDGTVVVRISRDEPSGSATFDSAPALLAVGVTTTQNSAPSGVTWHPWVDSTGHHAQILGFVRRTQPPQGAALAQADTQAVSWSVSRANGGAVAVVMPQQSGRYTISVLRIGDDGSVAAGSSTVVVRDR